MCVIGNEKIPSAILLGDHGLSKTTVRPRTVSTNAQGVLVEENVNLKQDCRKVSSVRRRGEREHGTPTFWGPNEFPQNVNTVNMSMFLTELGGPFRLSEERIFRLRNICSDRKCRNGVVVYRGVLSVSCQLALRASHVFCHRRVFSHAHIDDNLDSLHTTTQKSNDDEQEILIGRKVYSEEFYSSSSCCCSC
jgi:hypothetical protein